MAFRLLLHKHEFTPLQLLENLQTEALASYERRAITFAQQWLKGEQAYTIHTSGSTGVPKAIEISRGRMQASARLTLEVLRIMPGDRALLCINPDYIGGKMMLVRSIEGSLPLLVVEPKANPLQGLPHSFSPDFTALVPMQLQAILDDRESFAVLNSMKAVIVGGAAVSPGLEDELQKVKTPLYSTYGMTETVSHIALRRLNGEEREDFFRALPGIKISADERSCLMIKGPVADAVVVTNDVVELLGQGKFRWIGRADNTINSAGVKVQAEALEIAAEACLADLGHRRRLLVGGVPDVKLGQKVVLLVEGAAFYEETQQQLLACLQKKLPRYWVPKEILFLSRFVESSNGKIKRHDTWTRL